MRSEADVTKASRDVQSLEEFLKGKPSGEVKPEDRFLWEGQDVEIVFKKNVCPSCMRRSKGGLKCEDCQGRDYW